MKKKILAGLLVLFMVINWSGIIFAEGIDLKQNDQEDDLPLSYHGETEIKIDSIQSNTIPKQRSVSNLEETYFSPYVTAVKNQGAYGTCWAFSMIAASEASVVKEGLAIEDIDLSEWHLAYFLANSVTDPIGGTLGDSFTINGSYLMDGANQQMATYRVANWYGLVDEETAPYSVVCADSSADLPSSVAYNKDVVHLENAYWVAMKDQNIIKQLIKEYGACGASYYSESQYYNTYNPYNTEVAEYCPDNVSTNHGITIVGWDDTYSRDKFGTNQPEQDGAWYCKNSWGEQWGKDGYFWISYEDVPLSNGVGFFYDYGAADNYDHNYQYDGGAWGNYYTNCKYEANMYKAQGYERLKAVGFYTRNVQYNCTVSIYKNCEEGKPTSGELVATQIADQLYAGFHTVELEDNIVLNKDDCFSVVVCQTTADGGYVEISVDSSTSQENSWCVNTSNAEAGQSFISVSGTAWSDISGRSGKENCRIKAYTDDLIPVTDIKLSHSDVGLVSGKSIQLSAVITPQNADNRDVEWSSSDTDIASVSENGLVTGNGFGDAVITCRANDTGQIYSSCKISVRQAVTQIMLDQTKVAMKTGESVKLEAAITPDKDMTFGIYWMSDNEKAATVDSFGRITAVAPGTANIRCMTKDGSNVSGICVVTVLQPVTDIVLSAADISLQLGETSRIIPQILPASASNKSVVWSSSNNQVAAVTDSGVVTAAGVGTAVITCRALDGSGIVKSCTVAVSEKVVCHTKGKVLTDALTGAKYKVTRSGTEDATVEYMKSTVAGTSLVVPASVKIDGVIYKVTSIGANAFKNNRKIVKINIGDGVITIGTGAFSGCTKLKSVVLGKNVTSIESKAFYKCSRLTKITIPSTVKKIGKQAFYNCKRLKNITIKTSKLTSKRVGSKAFKGIHPKASIKVPKKKMKTYKKILRLKGIGKKVKIKK